MGSEISKKEKQGLSKEKGVALKEFIGNLYLNRQQSLPRDICIEKCEGDAFGQDPGLIRDPSLIVDRGEAQAWHCNAAFGNLDCNNSLHPPLSWSGQHTGENPASAAGFSARLEIKHVGLNGN